ncbi:hypothetical protein LTR27_007038 [Elasticomyces elasticus]|nr:hypothetical protein LTR27_007038 [Elasticomyces elasticus]
MLTTRNQVTSTIGRRNETYLRGLNALSPPKEDGFRTLSCSSYISSDNSSLDNSIEIPDHFSSPEGLQFCGLTVKASQEIYNRFLSSDNTFQTELDTFALGYIEAKAAEKNAILVSDDWDGALTHMGITRRKRDALLKDEHKEFRMLGTAETWAKEIVKDMYEWLLNLDNAITECGKHKSQRSTNLTRSGSPGPSVTPSRAIKPASRPTSSSGQLPYPVVESSVVIPQDVSEHTFIYKGGLTSRLEKVWADETSNALEFPNIYSTPPTDFHPQNPHILYFTKQKQVAEKYAKLQDDTKNPVSICILHVAVPKDILSQATPIFGTDFKQLVFESRLPNPRGRLSADLQRYANASLLVGPVCGQASDHLQRHVRDAAGVELMTLPRGESASQYGFQGNEMADTLNEKCKGKVWLEELQSRGVGRWRK